MPMWRGTCAAAAIALAAILNLHQLVLGAGLLECLSSSKLLVGGANALWRRSVRNGMAAEGIPAPNRTEAYAGALLMDVYESAESPNRGVGQPRPALLYFHAGAFITGGREFGRGTCSWAAAHGLVCFSVSYSLTTGGGGVVQAIRDAWAAIDHVRTHAKRLHIDPKRIVVAGDSAGALLALSLAPIDVRAKNIGPTVSASNCVPF